MAEYTIICFRIRTSNGWMWAGLIGPEINMGWSEVAIIY